MLGIGALETVNAVMAKGAANQSEDSIQVFKDPSVDLNVVFGATLLLIIAGLIAGYIPASKAVRIKPVEAMRAD